ncbi:MAG: MBL fold metallo-hydrolase [Corallococcus sp.]|nr:MBL fold metallo-hydrolase [Corallococcus sp.]
MITVTPLFSGSRGNCTLVRTDKTALLLDAGYGFRAIQAKLKSLGVAPREIAAIVVTHEHSDHISALPAWSRNYRTKVFAPPLVATFLQMQSVYNVEEVDGFFEVDDVSVHTYRCSHDSRNCFGYRFTSSNTSVAAVTDTGEPSAELVPFLAPCQTVILESNHDFDMLWNGSYPFYLKNRINSKYGHLSNAQASDVLAQLADSNVKNVILAHLSQQNNTKQAALSAVNEAYSKRGVVVGKDVNVYVADQYENEVTV